MAAKTTKTSKTTKRKTRPKTSRPDTSAPRRPRAKSRKGSSGGTSILHTCGHTQRHKLSRIPYKREREVTYQQSIACKACWAIQRAEEAESLCGVENLPEMTGTEGQVPWGRTIRANALGRAQAEAAILDRELTKRGMAPAGARLLALAVPRLLKKVSAKFWIDHREDLEGVLELFLPPKPLKELVDLREELTKPVIECPF
jgi:hypothetical protein